MIRKKKPSPPAPTNLDSGVLLDEGSHSSDLASALVGDGVRLVVGLVKLKRRI